MRIFSADVLFGGRKISTIAEGHTVGQYRKGRYERQKGTGKRGGKGGNACENDKSINVQSPNIARSVF